MKKKIVTTVDEQEYNAFAAYLAAKGITASEFLSKRIREAAKSVDSNFFKDGCTPKVCDTKRRRTKR